MIEVEKLATPLKVKMATFSCETNAGNRERAEWAHITCWGSQSELSVPFPLPSRIQLCQKQKYRTIETSCAKFRAIEQVNFHKVPVLAKNICMSKQFIIIILRSLLIRF